ncbi:MAG: helix-turn-helix transcriptional regulator [Rickettsiales bacterium]
MKNDKYKTVREVAKEWMKDPKFKKEYEALGDKYSLAQAVIEARIKSGLSQEKLAEKMNTTQPFIARMEAGRQLPSVASLLKLAKATGLKLNISFVDG